LFAFPQRGRKDLSIPKEESEKKGCLHRERGPGSDIKGVPSLEGTNRVKLPPAEDDRQAGKGGVHIRRKGEGGSQRETHLNRSQKMRPKKNDDKNKLEQKDCCDEKGRGTPSARGKSVPNHPGRRGTLPPGKKRQPSEKQKTKPVAQPNGDPKKSEGRGQ